MRPVIGFALTFTPAGGLRCRPVWYCVWLDAPAAAVKDAMALIGFVFHWSPDWCAAQSFSDLMDWRDRALDLHKAAHSTGEDAR